MLRNRKQVQRVARQIALALGEKDKMPQHQIKRIVEVCGVPQSLAWLREAQLIEAQGGMPTSDGSAQRTPGGVYFKLVRSTLIQTGQHEKMQIIFRGKKVESRRKTPHSAPEYGRGRGRPAGRSLSGNNTGAPPARRRPGAGPDRRNHREKPL